MDKATLIQIVSAERLQTYEQWEAQSGLDAVELYSLNVQLSEALYPMFHMTEVCLRNAFHQKISAKYGETWIFDDPFSFTSFQKAKIENAKEELGKKRPQVNTTGRMIAEMTFGFWCSLLSPDFEDSLFRPCLSRAFSNRLKGLPIRKDVSRPLSQLRTLRNRIAHHEPILYWSLQKHVKRCLELLSWISPAAQEWVKSHSRFAKIYPKEMLPLPRQ